MPTRTPQRAGRGSLTPRILMRILRDLSDILSRDMQITTVTHTPGGLLFTITSRTRPGHTHTVCRRKGCTPQRHPTYCCSCEHGLQIEEFTPANRHAHCWHVRFVHFVTLPPPARRHLLTYATSHATITEQQHDLRAVWRAYLLRRRAELRHAPTDRPSAPFIYALAARPPGKPTPPPPR